MKSLIKVLMAICLFAVVQSGLYAKYICILDAGSSGTRIRLFDVNFQNEKLTVIETKFGKDKDGNTLGQVKPGISAYASNPSKIEEYLTPLIEIVREKAPKDFDEKTTPLYLLATAGMRTVSPNDQKTVYDAVRRYFGKTTFLKQKAETISGEMEGVFDLLAVNYQLGYITKDSTASAGVMDLGGASMQVAYVTDKTEGPYVKNVKIGDPNDSITYNIRSRSYLGLGADLARAQYSDEDNCFSEGFPMPDEGKGTGQWKTGENCVDNLLTKVWVTIDPYTLDKSPEVKEFCAMSAFWSIGYLYFKLNPLTIQYMENKIDTFAGKQWDDLQKADPSNSFLFSTLFTSEYIVQILRTLKFAETDPIKLVDASWTTGAAIYKMYNDEDIMLRSNNTDEMITNPMATQLNWGSSM